VTFDPTSTVPTPEPGTLAIPATALAGLAGVRRQHAMRSGARDE
jgi:MYXO-CTERM domain-containing protein